MRLSVPETKEFAVSFDEGSEQLAAEAVLLISFLQVTNGADGGRVALSKLTLSAVRAAVTDRVKVLAIESVKTESKATE